MTEQEALDSLMADLLASEEVPEQQAKATQPTQATEQQATPEQVAEKNELPDIKAMIEKQSKMIEDLKAKVDTPKKGEEPQPQMTPEEMQRAEQIRLAQEELGITQLLQKQQQQEAEIQRAKQFQAEEAKFKQTHPEVNLDEMAKWAEGNGFSTVLGLGAEGWRLIAQAMNAQAKPVAKPDPITPVTSQGAEPSAFEQLKKGEYNPIALGEDLLKTAGF